MKWLDRLIEGRTRDLAQRSSRRSFLARVGTVVAGSAATLPLLPVARAQDEGSVPESGDPHSCDYWRYCATDGFLCSCCGGSASSCPPGTEMSPITWIGTCLNPVDNTNYIISYNDCCGKSACGHCMCTRNEGDRPIYRPQLNNEYNWCLGTQHQTYNCSVARVIGKAFD
ncbi:MAG: methylamine dehydrogenase light chain [Gammaproteobacteria bacterium]|nr:methylamine dehydrogenase light chain [Gammaproteobacteria bacterium]